MNTHTSTSSNTNNTTTTTNSNNTISSSSTASIYLIKNNNISYWERSTLLKYDSIVIGGGIVGLSTAISIKERQPTNNVLVLERDIIPTGASTKNAGFACVGSITEILDDLKTMSEEDVVNLVRTRYQGLLLLRNRLGDKNIGYQDDGSFELIREKETYALDHIERINKLLYQVFGDGNDAFTLCDQSVLEKSGFSQVRALVKNNYEGSINTGKMMKSYTELAYSLGIHIKTGCLVESFYDNGVHVKLSVYNSTLKKKMEFKCKKLAICTNAFTRDLIPNIDCVPGRGQVLVTEPIENLPFKGIYHMDEGYYYYREVDGCVLFGGGRNLDFKGEQTTDFGFTDVIQSSLENYLRTVILPNRDFKISHRWSGIMAFGKDKKPIISRHSDNVVLGVRMGGMGVAIGSLVGQQVSNLMLSPVSKL
eukprot:gene4647-5805_t